ncbi:MAG: hypothetical protein QNK82_11125 [Akkermansiaceae bacterium]|jgi:hypothetical protein|tara:strand:- start:475 stop:1104 length:630 start_codon:yes stop_codon:yes gene_type:complete
MALNKKTTIITALAALILPVAAKHHAVEPAAETGSGCDALTGFYGIGISTGSFSASDGSAEDADGYTLGLSLDIAEDTNIFLLYQDYDGGDFNEVTAVARKSYDLIDGFITAGGLGYGTQSVNGSVTSNALVAQVRIGTEIAGIGLNLTYDHNFVLDSEVNDDFATIHLVGTYQLTESMRLWAAYEWQVSGDTLVEKDDTTSIGISINF